MKKHIIEYIKNSKQKGDKLIAVLLDPDKISIDELLSNIIALNKTEVSFIFVGGSTVTNGLTDPFVRQIKKLSSIPVVLFPGDHSQLTEKADAVLFLSLLSGRNPEFLIEQQIKSVNFLKGTSLEIIPTGYLLIEGGIETSVQKVSKTTPISQSNLEEILNTSIAAEYLGKQIIYLEAGSGATTPVNPKIIRSVSENIDIPIIVGGGIRTKQQLENAFDNGADLVVIGTAFENNSKIFNTIV